VVGVWTFSLVSAVFWLWLFNSEAHYKHVQLAVAIVSGLGAGLATISLGVVLVVNRRPLSPLLIVSALAGLAICVWSTFIWWTYHNFFSGTGPFL
jgi:ABC-type Mn2+/Zn2+ transport system permease subunit